MAAFPVRDINIYLISPFREETAITPRDGKIIKDKSNYPPWVDLHLLFHS